MKKEIQERINAVRSGSIPKGYKKVRHMLFPDDWGELVALNTVLTENKERNKELKFDKDDVLSVSGEHGVVNQIELLGRSYAGESVEPYHVVNTGDIVYTKSPLKQNPHGIIKMNKGKPGIVSTLYAVYHCNNSTTAQYLENYFCIDSYLNNYLKPLVKRGAKNDMKVNNEDVLTGVVPLPSLEEQEKINGFISVCNHVIRLKEKLIIEKTRQKKWFLQQLFRNKNVQDKFSSTWETVELSGVFEYIQPTKYLVCEDNYSDEYDIPVLTAGKTFVLGYTDETKGIFSDVPVVIFDDFTTDSKYVDFRFKAKSSAMKILKIKDGYNIKFAFAALQNIRYTVGGHERHWISKFAPMTVEMPPLEIQNKIAEIINTFDSSIYCLEKELNYYKKKEKLLQQLLLTGIVRIK